VEAIALDLTRRRRSRWRHQAIATAPAAQAMMVLCMVLCGWPELERDENHDCHDERSFVPFARLALHRGGPFFEGAHLRSDAACCCRPEKILSADSDFLVEVEEQRGRQILRNEH
jgi:hypothetical protein